MAKTHPPYAPEYRTQMVELVPSGRSAGELAPLNSGAVLRRFAIGCVRPIATTGVVTVV